MTGTRSDFKIYQEEFWGGYTEVLQQNSNAFNGASRNSIRLIPQRRRGEFAKESFFKSIAAIVGRRDAGVGAVAGTGLTQGEIVRVKLDRRIGPIEQTLDSLRKIGSDQGEMSFLLGQQIAEAVSIDYLNTAVRSAVSASANNVGVYTDVSGETTPTMTHTHLVSGMAKFGDASDRIVAFVMHSKVYFDLVKQAIADKIDTVASASIYQGNVATFNRPVIVTDSDALVVAGSPTKYYTLGLVADGVLVEESEGREMMDEIVLGTENIFVRMQGEYAFNLGVRGYAWDITNGGVNPANAALGTGTNWDKQVSSDKLTAGIAILSQ